MRGAKSDRKAFRGQEQTIQARAVPRVAHALVGQWRPLHRVARAAAPRPESSSVLYIVVWLAVRPWPRQLPSTAVFAMLPMKTSPQLSLSSPWGLTSLADGRISYRLRPFANTLANKATRDGSAAV